VSIAAFSSRYAAGERVADVLSALLTRIDAGDDPALWISRVPREELLAAADALDALDVRARAAKPLFGIPFAVKDNIDVAGMPTTAGCPAYAYVPAVSATVVRLLVDAGAVLVGKTNMDQFATGLVGTRSPYGVPRNPFDPAYIPGGSSSGSAVAVARAFAAFALGTDTAGSGRVPAACTATVGLKPTKGRASTAGVVPACRSLDCVSIFAANVDDAATVFATIAAFDAEDPFSRSAPPMVAARGAGPVRLGVPAQRIFFDDAEAAASFERTVAACAAAGVSLVDIDLEPFFDAAALLYEGPFVAERTAALGAFIDAHPDDVLAVTRTIIAGGSRYSAVDVFEAEYRLRAYQRVADAVFAGIDALLVPTIPTVYRVDDVLAEPYVLNARLGTYTNFVNLLDLCALAVPSGRYAGGMPIGVTLVGPAFGDERLVALVRDLGDAVVAAAR
jgi:allophanate hydrolase